MGLRGILCTKKPMAGLNLYCHVSYTLRLQGSHNYEREIKIGEKSFVSFINTLQRRECAPTKSVTFSEEDTEHTDICIHSHKVRADLEVSRPCSSSSQRKN